MLRPHLLRLLVDSILKIGIDPIEQSTRLNVVTSSLGKPLGCIAQASRVFTKNRSKPVDLLPETLDAEKRDQPAQLGEVAALSPAGQLGQLHSEYLARRFEE
jgi:hypothetical protein